MKNDKVPDALHTGLNVLSMWGQRITGIAVTIIITPIITRHFGLETVGVWLLVSQLIQHLMLLELGLNSALTRFLSRHLASNNKQLVGEYLSATIIILLGIGVLIVAGAPVVAFLFPKAISVSTDIDSQIFWLTLLGSITVGLSLPLRTGIGMLSSVHRFNRLALWEAAADIIKLSIVVICFSWYNPSLLTFGLVTFVPMLLANILIFQDGRKCLHGVVLQWKRPEWTILRTIFSMSGAALIVTSSALIVRQSSAMFVGLYLGVIQIPMLAYPILITTSFSPFIIITARIISPIAAQIDVTGNRKKLYELFTVSARYTTSLSIYFLLVLWAQGDFFLRLWLGTDVITVEQADKMHSILLLLFLGFVISVPGIISRAVLSSVGHHWTSASIELTGAVIGIGVGVILTIINQDVIGMALGIFVAFSFRGMRLLFWAGRYYFIVSYWKIFKDCLMLPAVQCCLLFASMNVVSDYWNPSTLWQEAIYDITSISLAWLLSFVLFIMLAAHRSAALSRLLRVINR